MNHSSDSLLLLYTEAFEDRDLMDGLRSIQTTLPHYKDVEPKKPIFYAPIDGDHLSQLITSQPGVATVISQGKYNESFTWQLEEVARLMKEQRIQTVEIIGNIDSCAEGAGLLLADMGFVVTVRLLTGKIIMYGEDSKE